MKNSIKTFWAVALTICAAVPSFAQENADTRLLLGRIEPYQMEVTYDKTSHLIFPTAIRYVDLGSEYLVAGKAEDAENVLRIKASVKDFGPETNFSVITDDGRFYSFNVRYSLDPDALGYDLSAMQRVVEKAKKNDVLFKELGDSSPAMVGGLMETIYRKGRRTMEPIEDRESGIRFALKGIYVHNGKYYFHTELENGTNVPFGIDLISFKVVDKKVAKRTMAQERSLMPLRTYRSSQGMVNGKSSDGNVFVFDPFTIARDKVLLIEVFGKNGGRHLELHVKTPDLIKALSIDGMKLVY